VGDRSQEVFIGRESISNSDHSEETQRVVDAEVKRLVESGMKQAEELLRANLDALHRVADALLERETINGAELKLLMDGQPLPPPAAQEAEAPAGDEDEGFLIEDDDESSGDGDKGPLQ
jgi:cell division protease FtsH